MRQFLVILGFTLLVWLGVSLSEPTEYPVDVKVTFEGYDTVRYAVVSADSVANIRLTSNGFTAIKYSFRHMMPVISLKVTSEGGQHSIPTQQVCTELSQKVVGISNIVSITDTLHITLSPRASRTYKPNLDKVSFSFAEQYALYGEPVLTPSEVTLYGPQQILDTIEQLPIANAHIDGINASGHFRLQLEPIWFGTDIHPSTTEVDVFLPVEAYVERSYQVPIQVIGADTNVQLRLYPSQVTLNAWIAQRDLHHKPDIVVGIDYADIISHNSHITPRLIKFPTYIRPRNIMPDEVQCVAIK